ncbi:hypothetical protein Bbelb_401570 [Branchiostoma belcheri]|nr:hypothetical protein Bbelb_401570 [Branchiostoma belcheri]
MKLLAGRAARDTFGRVGHQGTGQSLHRSSARLRYTKFSTSILLPMPVFADNSSSRPLIYSFIWWGRRSLLVGASLRNESKPIAPTFSPNSSRASRGTLALLVGYCVCILRSKYRQARGARPGEKGSIFSAFCTVKC